jgi:Tol biopolymer transport system component
VRNYRGRSLIRSFSAPVLLGSACAVLVLLLAASSASAAGLLAFPRYDPSTRSYRIWTIAADGSGLTQLTPGTTNSFAPAFSPSRRTIAFIRTRSGDSWDLHAALMLMRSDGARKRVLHYTGASLTSGASALAYSPNGRYLAGGTALHTKFGYGQRWAVTILNLKTHRSHVIFRYDSQSGVVSLTWSPDSSQLVATTEYGGGYGMFRLGVAAHRLLKNYKFMAASASWQPHGRLLLCAEWYPDEPGYPMKTILRQLDGSLAATLGEGQQCPVYSPSGTQYAYLTYSADGTTSWLRCADADGSNATTILTSGSGQYIGALAWK